MSCVARTGDLFLVVSVYVDTNCGRQTWWTQSIKWILSCTGEFGLVGNVFEELWLWL